MKTKRIFVSNQQIRDFQGSTVAGILQDRGFNLDGPIKKIDALAQDGVYFEQEQPTVPAWWFYSKRT